MRSPSCSNLDKISLSGDPKASRVDELKIDQLRTLNNIVDGGDIGQLRNDSSQHVS